MLIEARNAFGVGKKNKKPTARDYVCNLSNWDGLENAGYGVHDYTTNTWKDLLGFADLSCQSVGNRWDVDGFNFNGTYAFYNLISNVNARCSAEWSAECVYSLSQNMTNYVGLFGSRLEAFGIYGLNYWSDVGGYNCGTGSNGAYDAFTARNTPAISALTTLNIKHHMVLTYKVGQSIALWHNGVKIATKPWPVRILYDRPGYMLGRGYAQPPNTAANSDSTRVFKGKIFAHRLSSIVLPDADIIANYTTDKIRYDLP